MSVNDIGKLLFAGFEGVEFSEDGQAAKLIRDHRVHCFLIKRHNYVNIQQLKTLLNDLQAFAYNCNFDSPLALSIDIDLYDHMRDQNLKELTVFPPSLASSATGNFTLCYNIGKAVGLEFKAIGFNMMIGPILDIFYKVSNSKKGINTLGATVDEVSKYAVAFGCGIKSIGLLTSGCSFPGMGNTSIDSVTNDLILVEDYNQIENKNILPFKAMIEVDALDSILVTSAFAPNALYDDLSCCLNPKIVDTLLREKLDFDKLVIGGCLETYEIILNYGIGQAAALSILYAHCDMITVCKSYKHQLEALEFLQKSFEHNNNQAILITALRRIDEFLNKITWFDSKVEITPDLKQNHEKLSNDAYRNSISLVRDLYGMVPAWKYFKQYSFNFNPIDELAPNDKLITIPNLDKMIRSDNIMTLLTPTNLPVYKELVRNLIEYGKDCNCIVNHFVYNNYEITKEIRLALENSIYIVVIQTNEHEIKIIKEISRLLSMLSKKLMIVSVNSPYYFLDNDTIAGTFISTYDNSPKALNYLAQLIFGKFRATGRVPGFYGKLNSREEVVMGLSNSLDSSEWQFDFLLNKPAIAKPLSKLSTPTNLQFENNMYANEISALLNLDQVMLNHNSNPNTNQSLSSIENNIMASNNASSSIFDSNYKFDSNSDKPKDTVSELNYEIDDEDGEDYNRTNIKTESQSTYDTYNRKPSVVNNGSNSNRINPNIPSEANNTNRRKGKSAYNIVNNEKEMSEENKIKEKPWVVEDYNDRRDKSFFGMIRENTINDIYYPLNSGNGLIGRIWAYGDRSGDTKVSFIVRNPTLNVIYGVVTVIIDEYSKTGRVIYMVVSKAKRRQGVGEILHRRAIQYMTIVRGCTTIALGSVFPFYNYLVPKVLNEISSIWQYLETKDDSKIDIDDSSIQLVGFFRSLGWNYTRHTKGVYQQTRKYLLHLKLKNWRFPAEQSPFIVNSLNIKINSTFEFIEQLNSLNVKFILSNDPGPGFEICHRLLKSGKTKDDEEIVFSTLYSKTKEFIRREIEDYKLHNKRRSTMAMYAFVDGVIQGGCIIYTSNSEMGFYYPLIDQYKKTPAETVAGITGVFINSLEDDKQLSPRNKKLIQHGLISACVDTIGKLGIEQLIIHNISKETMPELLSCGFVKSLEYCACFGKKRAFEWVV